MATPGPELIHMAGPQAGERSAVLASPAVVGRSSQAEVQMAEQFISRQHLQFTYTRDGWVMEILSSNGAWINGKRFKPNKKILLDTGDVIQIGRQTELLYVQPDDDPDLALAAWRSEKGAPAEAKPPAGEGEATEAAPDEAAAPEAQDLPPEADEQPADSEDSERKTRSRRLAIIAGGSVVGTIALIALLSTLKTEEGPVSIAQVPRLSATEIEEILRSRPERLPDALAAEQELAQARAMYENRGLRRGDLYRCVVHFKLNLAYRNSRVFSDLRDGPKFEKAMQELVGEVTQKYHTAWAYAKSENWSRAARGFRELLDILPADQRRDPEVYDKLLANIRAHLSLADRNIAKR